MVKIQKNNLYLVVIILLAFNFWAWPQIIFSQTDSEAAVYFLNVGKGESHLINFGPVNILVDGGQTKQTIEALSKILDPSDRYLDLIILTHPHIDHYGGLSNFFTNYQVGAFIYAGQTSPNPTFKTLLQKISAAGTPIINLAAADQIAYLQHHLDFLAPAPELIEQKNPNESSLVFKLDDQVLFVGDIGFPTERLLLRQGKDLTATVLKVGHHGSKYSSSPEFIAAVNPKVAVISVGPNNYGHPSDLAINSLKSAGAQVIRTDQDGTIKLVLD